ncbi:sodium:solute symporter family transporter [Paraburkholderia pallida]|uniref:Transporter n=1 Tax=Paraburkholderia pallida TaxID=2547399 RepID=A0A4P7D403_9BURK|nr:transporter [Paraburkholderia pallida]QBR03389.1 transporter [Paraburkholderia pallida]
MNFNTAVVVGYFVLIGIINFSFRRMASKSSTDYFRGGGRMLWWMVGSSAFMIQFSAWTFTGAAGEAFRNGFPAVYVFIGNVLAFLLAWAFFAKKFRQMRVDTPTEAVRRRFGESSELFFTWAIIPLSIIQGGVWLNSLSVFFSAVMGIKLGTTLWITGLAVLSFSMIGGAWGVAASDFVQSMVVAVMSIACAAVALFKVGGVGEIVHRFPGNFFYGPDTQSPMLLTGLFLFLVVKQILTINNMKDSYRFLGAKDSFDAKKGALFAFLLMLAGAMIWMIPPWASAILFPDAGIAHSAQLGKKASDAVYLVFAERAMPLGTVGLLMAGLFSATMAAADGALNHNAGIFVRSFYQPVIRRGKQVSDREALVAGKIVNATNGLLIILTAQFYSQLNQMSLFDLMMRVSTLAQVPILVPLFLGALIRKVPDWASWATVVFGLVVSYFVSNVVTAHEIAGYFHIALSASELSAANTVLAIAAHVFLTGGFFCLTMLFYREPEQTRREQLDSFYHDFAREVVSDASQSEFDRLQRHKLGRITLMMGAGLFAMLAIPNPLWGRLLFLCCALAILVLGALMCRSANPVAVPGKELQSQSS